MKRSIVILLLVIICQVSFGQMDRYYKCSISGVVTEPNGLNKDQLVLVKDTTSAGMLFKATAYIANGVSIRAAIAGGGLVVTAGGSSGNYEPTLGNPSINGYVLSSTTSGTRSWIPMSGGSSDSTWSSITLGRSGITDGVINFQGGSQIAQGSYSGSNHLSFWGWDYFNFNDMFHIDLDNSESWINSTSFSLPNCTNLQFPSLPQSNANYLLYFDGVNVTYDIKPSYTASEVGAVPYSEKKAFVKFTIDSTAINTSIKYQIDYSTGYVIDTIVYIATTTAYGGTVSVTPKIYYGTDISATGTAVITSPSAVTTRTTATKVYSFNNATVSAGNLVWLTFSATAAIPRNFMLVIIAHRL